MKKQIKKHLKHWRRPFKRQGLSKSSKKNKEGNPGVLKGKNLLEMEKYLEYDGCWNVYDPEPDDWYYWRYLRPEPYEENVEHFNLHHRLLEEIIQLPASPFNELESIEKSLKPSDDTPLERLPPNFLMLEKALYDHIKEFCFIKADDVDERVLYLRESARCTQNIEKVIQFANNLQNMQVAKAIMFFSPFWIRSPKTWEGGDEFSFIKHIFAEYDVPQFLYREWFRGKYDDIYDRQSGNINYLRFEWLSWLIILGQGSSLKKAASFFYWRIPSGFQHFLQDLPDDLSPVEACIFSEVKRLGGNNIDATRLLRHGFFVIDPKEESDENYFKFWQDTVRWLVTHHNDISDDESEIILSWAVHQYTEMKRANYNREIERQNNAELSVDNNHQNDLLPQQSFTLKGRSVQRVLGLSNEYLRQKSLPWIEYSWKNHGWDFILDDPLYSGWEIVELTNGKELHREGSCLGHCVSSYAGRCVANISAIFSMRFKGESIITIEVNPYWRQIIQARGKGNREATSREKQVIDKWVREVLNKDNP